MCIAEKFDLLRDERSLGVWNFEVGGYVRIACSKAVETEAALDMVEKLVEMKREELAKLARAAQAKGPTLQSR